MKKALIFLLIMICIISSTCTQSLAATDQNLIKDGSSALVGLGLIQPDKKGNLRLNDKIKRSEFITLVVNEMDLVWDTEIKDVKISFTDVTSKYWAYTYIKIAVKYGFLSGESTMLKPDSVITLSEAETILTRALGYEAAVKDKLPEGYRAMAVKLGLEKGLDPEKNISDNLTRGEAFILIYNSLTVDFN